MREVRDAGLGMGGITGLPVENEECACGWKWKHWSNWTPELVGLLREQREEGGWSLGQILQLNAVERRDLLTEVENQAKEAGRWRDTVFTVSRTGREYCFTSLRHIFIWTLFFSFWLLLLEWESDSLINSLKKCICVLILGSLWLGTSCY